jgi:AraC-like DNA-binding protein
VNTPTARAYAEKFNSLFDYIDKHLDEDLSVERLSQVVNFSKYHFHRQFSEYAGINVFRYIQTHSRMATLACAISDPDKRKETSHASQYNRI